MITVLLMTLQEIVRALKFAVRFDFELDGHTKTSRELLE